MKVFRIIIFLLAIHANLFTQGQTSVFQKHFDGASQDVRAICKTNDGNYIAVTARLDISIVKLDENGDSLWLKRYDTNNGIQCYGIVPTPDNGFVFAGSKRNGSAIEEGYVVKIDSVGNIVWKNELNLSGYFSRIENLAVGNDSSIAVVGYYGTGSDDIGYVSKISANGNLLWTRRIGSGSGDFSLRDVTYDAANNIYVAGERDASPDGNIISKFDPLGNTIWSKMSNLTSTESLGIDVLSNGDIILGGWVVGVFGSYDVLFQKFNNTGNLLTSYVYGTPYRERIRNSIYHNGNVVFFGNAVSASNDYQSLLMSIDTSGSINFAKAYGDSLNHEFGWSGTTTHDGGYIITSEPGIASPVIIKTDSLGHVGCYEDNLNVSFANHNAVYSNSISYVSSTPTYQTYSALVAYSGPWTYKDSVICSSTICNLSASANVTSNYNGSDISCNGASDGQATVSVVGGSGTQTYNWSSGGTTSIESGLGDGTYYCIVTDGICVDTAYVTLTEPSPLIISTSGNVDICLGDSTNISASGANTYNWDNGTGSGSTVSVSPSITTQYIVTGTDANNCQDTAQVTVTVNPLPNVSIQAYSPDTLCSTNAPVTLPNGTPAGGTYSGTGITGGNFDPNLSGLGTHYTVYTYTDGNSCTNSDSTAITVNTCVGIKDITLNNSVVISPNPNNGRFTITNNHLPIKALRIFNLLGKLVYSQENISSFEVTVNEESVLPGGTYLLEIVDQEFNTYTHKMLVK